MSKLSRRNVLKSVLSGATMASLPSVSWPQENTPVKRKGNIRQSVSRWCYRNIPLDKLCAYAAEIGLKGVDLLIIAGSQQLNDYVAGGPWGYMLRARCPCRR